MSKVITSPVKRYSGTVTLSYPLTYPQYAAWRKAIESLPDGAKWGEVVGNDDLVLAMLPGVCACVEKWELAGMGEHVSPMDFPATPRIASARLLIWLIGEITSIVAEEDDSPLS